MNPFLSIRVLLNGRRQEAGRISGVTGVSARLLGTR